MHKQQINILSTKIIGQKLRDLAGVNGIIIDDINFIQTVNLNDDINRVREIAAGNNVVIFTSANAVYAIAYCIEGRQPMWDVYCLDGKTKMAVKEQLPGVVIRATAPDAATLAEIIITDNNKVPLYFFCGNLRLDDLPTYLHQANTQLNEIVVYETTLTPQKTSRYYDGVIFYSPSGVSSFFMENSITDDTTIFAIGRTTAKTFSNFLNEVVVSPEPDMNVLFKTIINYYKNKQT